MNQTLTNALGRFGGCHGASKVPKIDSTTLDSTPSTSPSAHGLAPYLTPPD